MNADRRTTASAAHLTVDRLVAHGGIAILSETPEIYGAEQLLTACAVTPEVAVKLAARGVWWEDYTARNGGVMSVDEAGEMLFRLMLVTASGAPSRSAAHCFGVDGFVRWSLGAVMSLRNCAPAAKLRACKGLLGQRGQHNYEQALVTKYRPFRAGCRHRYKIVGAGSCVIS